MNLLQPGIDRLQQPDVAFGIPASPAGTVHAATAIPFVPDLIVGDLPPPEGRDGLRVPDKGGHRLVTARISALIVERIVVCENSERLQAPLHRCIHKFMKQPRRRESAPPPLHHLPRHVVADGPQPELPDQIQIGFHTAAARCEMGRRADEKFRRILLPLCGGPLPRPRSQRQDQGQRQKTSHCV